MSPLNGPQIEELVGILCEVFRPQLQLEMLVRVTLNVDLLTEFAEAGPLRLMAFKLVQRLEQQGLTATLLRGALRMSGQNPRVVAFCMKVAPELLAPQASPVQQVAVVVTGLESLRARLGEPEVRDAVAASRDQWEQIGSRVDHLDRYKRLHDGLHMIQVSYYRQVVDAVKRFKTDPTVADTLDEYSDGLQTLSAQARATATSFPADDSGQRDEEVRWVNVLDAEVVANLKLARKTADVPRARMAAIRLKTLLTMESARVNHALTEVARQLPLNRLIETLGKLAGPAPEDQPLRDGLAGLRQLYPRLVGQIAGHTQWQRVENELWQAEDGLDRDGPDGREEFTVLWPAIRGDVQALIDLDRAAEWAGELTGRAADVEAALAAPAGPREAFRRYRRQAMLRFFQVDLSLRDLCGAITAIGTPITALLNEA